MKDIPSCQSKRNAFTLLEVMVAVVIISTVIASLIQMMGNSSHIFSKVKTESKVGQYASFLIGSKDYGFEDKRISINKLSEDFELDSDLRRRLKQTKAKLIYTELESIDMSEFDESSDDSSTNDVSSSLVFEIGKSTLKFKDNSASLLRLRIQ